LIYESILLTIVDYAGWFYLLLLMIRCLYDR